MNDRDDLGGDIIEISDHFMDEVRTMRFFSLASVDGAVQTARRSPQVRLAAMRTWELAAAQLSDVCNLGLDLAYASERLIPARFEL